MMITHNHRKFLGVYLAFSFTFFFFKGKKNVLYNPHYYIFLFTAEQTLFLFFTRKHKLQSGAVPVVDFTEKEIANELL